MRIARLGPTVFAVTLIGLGLMGLSRGGFAPIWHSAPQSLPGRGELALLGTLLLLGCGTALLWPTSAPSAARTLFVSLLLWLLLIKLPYVLHAPTAAVAYESCGETAVLLAAAWVLYALRAGEREQQWLAPLTGMRGIRHARSRYALAMIAFGAAHFAYAAYTAALVPTWLPRHMVWVYLTGGAYLAAGCGLLGGVAPRLAVTLSTLQMGLFTLLVWVPTVARSDPTAAALSECALSWALTAGGWVVADSCRTLPWLPVAIERHTVRSPPQTPSAR